MDHQIESAVPSPDNLRRLGGSGRRRLLAAGLICCVGAASSLYAEIYVKELISNSSTPQQQSLNNNDAALSLVDEYFSGDAVDNNSNEPNEEKSRRRQLSIGYPDGSCRVTYAQRTQVDIAPTWQASFPGSGARMTWSLIEGLTGIRTNDDHNSHERGYDRVVAVKTHYPVKNGGRTLFEELDYKFGRAIVILRDPASAIPSYFNLLYEHRYGLPNHSTRAPNEDWLEFRDHPNIGLTAQLVAYEKFVEYWMNKYEDRSNLLMVSFEDLIDNKKGWSIASRIAHFLGQNEGVEHIADRHIPCVWETIVNYKNHPYLTEEELTNSTKYVSTKRKATTRKNGRRLLGIKTAEDGTKFVDPSSLRTGPKIRQYTEENLASMMNMYKRLAAKYSYDEDLVRIMSMYAEHAKHYENPPEE